MTAKLTLLTVGQLREALAALTDDMVITCGASASNVLWPIVGISVIPDNSMVPCKLILNTSGPVTEPRNIHNMRATTVLPPEAD